MTRAEDPQATIEAMQLELDEKEATVEALQTQVAALTPTGTPAPSPTPTPEPSEPEAAVTEFGEEGSLLIVDGVSFAQTRVTFDPNVEVRTFIGDYSIVPRRGQFLVIWFYQQPISEIPLPLGNFELLVLEPGGDKRISSYPLAKEAFMALALTEFDWNPELMQKDLTYRTGIVFDIKPEDVHFRLMYETASTEAGKKKTWIDLEFRA
jgi:hypothetical protein